MPNWNGKISFLSDNGKQAGLYTGNIVFLVFPWEVITNASGCDAPEVGKPAANNAYNKVLLIGLRFDLVGNQTNIWFMALSI